jgi:hypothetical protein
VRWIDETASANFFASKTITPPMAEFGCSSCWSLEESVVRLLLGINRFVDFLREQFARSDLPIIPILLDLVAQIEAKERTLDVHPLLHFFHIVDRRSTCVGDFLTDLIVSVDPIFAVRSSCPVVACQYEANGASETCCFCEVDVSSGISVPDAILRHFQGLRVSSVGRSDVLLFQLKSISSIDVQSSLSLDLTPFRAPCYDLSSIICQPSPNRFRTEF